MRKFKTESKKLLDLMINSIYTNREIFLRELISNASDAEDKLYFRSLTDKSVQLSKDDLTIRVSWDEEARTITVSDRGIGMDDEGLEKNLGVIAHSDSLEFKTAQGAPIEDEDAESAKEKEEREVPESVIAKDVDIIGQFGVGFYSSFMVAKQVKVLTKPYGSDQAWSWTSDGIEGYTIAKAEKDEHGTDVILTLKDNTEEDNYDNFLTEYGLKDLIRRYSNYVRYPIQMECMHQRKLPEPDPKPEDYTPEWETYTELETVNSMVPIWKRRKSEVSEEDYAEFYKSQFHDFADPARTISVHAEGSISYDVLLFIPSRRPFDLYSADFEKGVELYSSNVLIMEKCSELLPDYYNFVRGVVDSQDLSLNISRETLQHNSQLLAIARKIEKKITSELESMRDKEREDYESFFENFGRGLKYGIYSSYGAKKDELAPLLLFFSARDQKMVTLDEYVEGMAEEQKAIYFASGETTERLSRLPMVQSVLEQGYDVLLCTQDVDEFCLGAMMNYADHEIQNVAGANLDLASDADKEAAEAATKDNEDLLRSMKEALGDSVERVAVSPVLQGAPASISTEGPVSLEMEKIMAGMPDAEGLKSQRVLELSAEHPVFAVLQQAQKDGDAEKVAAYSKILYNQALLIEGMSPEDPVAFAEEISKLMK